MRHRYLLKSSQQSIVRLVTAFRLVLGNLEASLLRSSWRRQNLVAKASTTLNLVGWDGSSSCEFCQTVFQLVCRTLFAKFLFSSSQAGVMLLGAFFTKIWVANPCDIDGNPRSLEDLGKGKQARQAMEKEEKEARNLITSGD